MLGRAVGIPSIHLLLPWSLRVGSDTSGHKIPSGGAGEESGERDAAERGRESGERELRFRTPWMPWHAAARATRKYLRL